MSRELTLRQRATDFEGRPNRRALVALGGVVLVAFVGGFLLHPGDDDAPAAIPAQRLTSDAAPARESGATPTLHGAAAFPALRAEPRRRTRSRQNRAAAKPAAPAATPTPALTTDDLAAPTPDPVTPATPAPAPAAPAPAAPAPKPARPAPPTQSFDSTG